MITINYMLSDFNRSADDNLHIDAAAAFGKCIDAMRALKDLQRITSDTDVGMLKDDRRESFYEYLCDAKSILKRMMYITLAVYYGDYRVEECKEDKEDKK